MCVQKWIGFTRITFYSYFDAKQCPFFSWFSWKQIELGNGKSKSQHDHIIILYESKSHICLISTHMHARTQANKTSTHYMRKYAQPLRAGEEREKCSREIIIKMSLQDQKAINSTNYWRPNMCAFIFSLSVLQRFSIFIRSHSVSVFVYLSLCLNCMYIFRNKCICMRSLCCVLFWFRFNIAIFMVCSLYECVHTHTHTRTMVCSIFNEFFHI